MNTEGARVRHDAKNTIFLDLFSIPKYRLELMKALHPEMTDLTEDDIKPVTLNPVILNGQYNDLALLVRNKLIIFAEAQSTWSINILVRILLYLAGTYQDYITGEGCNVYSSRKINLPEAEFYVIYTGDRKIEKDVISLSEDFWHNPNSQIDLRVKVIHSGNKNDIIGQYIIFSKVLDEQIRLHGRKKIALENAMRICQNEGVLRGYLEGRKKEVIEIMTILFDQEYATEAYALERERKGEKRGKIKGVVDTCRRLGATIEDAIRMVAEDLQLSEEAASKSVRAIWKS